MLILIYVTITLALGLSYVTLLLYVSKQWDAIPNYSLPLSTTPLLNLTVLIPARNEAANISSCLQSILNSINKCEHQVEVIVINDHSEDNTADLVSNYRGRGVRLYNLKDHLQGMPANAYKKLALKYGLTQAQGDYIIQLDADTVVAPDYLLHVSSAIINTEANFIAAPVILVNEGSRLGHFQTLDLTGMMGLTAAGIASKQWHLANGANMIYRKSIVNYEEDLHASGDDIYTIQAVASNPSAKVVFLKNTESIVSTPTQVGIGNFFSQRLRWATKNKYMKGRSMLIMMGIPFLNVLWLPLHLLFFFIIGPVAVSVGLFHLLMKIGIDYIYLSKMSNFFKVNGSMRYFWSASLIHIAYLIGVGIISLVKRKYTWKGRTVT